MHKSIHQLFHSASSPVASPCRNQTSTSPIARLPASPHGTSPYEEITRVIIAQLEQGVVPWRSPYFSEVGFPSNYSTGAHYRGINAFLLGSRGFTSSYFLTFLQTQKLDGRIRKGERGTRIIKYGTFSKEDENLGGDAESEKLHRFLKVYTVFNASQIEGIDFPVPDQHRDFQTTDATDRARSIIAGMPKPPKFGESSAQPCYQPEPDIVQMPEQRFFHSEEDYYKTLFHELSHSTGHQSRLARKSLLENKGMAAAGSARKVYCEEELVAEMGACFLSAHAGIAASGLPNSAAYLQSWIAALKSEDATSWIIRAASQAQKAADYILDVETTREA